MSYLSSPIRILPISCRCSSHLLHSYLQIHFIGFGVLQSIFWNYGWIPPLDLGPLQFFLHVYCPFLSQPIFSASSVKQSLHKVACCVVSLPLEGVPIDLNVYLPTSVSPCSGSLLSKCPPGMSLCSTLGLYHIAVFMPASFCWENWSSSCYCSTFISVLLSQLIQFLLPAGVLSWMGGISQTVL